MKCEKYCIIGGIKYVHQEKIGGDFKSDYNESIIAIFDTKEQAEDYIKKSRLKQRIRQTFGSDKVFKQKSLLAGCEYAYVEKYVKETDPIHNPEL